MRFLILKKLFPKQMTSSSSFWRKKPSLRLQSIRWLRCLWQWCWWQWRFNCDRLFLFCWFDFSYFSSVMITKFHNFLMIFTYSIFSISPVNFSVGSVCTHTHSLPLNNMVWTAQVHAFSVVNTAVLQEPWLVEPADAEQWILRNLEHWAVAVSYTQILHCVGRSAPLTLVLFKGQL